MQEKYSYELKIPKSRIAVLIGKKGETKKELEDNLEISIQVDSKEGDTVITGQDPITLFNSREIITAIGRGFNPEIALQLRKQDYTLELIELKEYVKKKNMMKRLKGRVIGQEGKARKVIEDLTETSICVYGKTIGIIGEVARVAAARRAIVSLLNGSVHSSVYKWLEKQRKVIKEQELIE